MDDIKKVVSEEVGKAMAALEEEIPIVERNEAIRWVRQQMEQQRKRAETWERVRGSVVGWLIVVAIGGLGTAVYQYALSVVSSQHSEWPGP